MDDIFLNFAYKLTTNYMTLKTIPEAFKIDSLVKQTTYLVDGELKEWSGKMTDVYSTISSTDTYEPTLLGSVPVDWPCLD